MPVGGKDLDHYKSPPSLARAVGDEEFDIVANSPSVIEQPTPGEVTWRDDAGVTCRQWNWGQCTRTRITLATTSAVFITDGLAAAGDDLVSSLIPLNPQATIATRFITP